MTKEELETYLEEVRKEIKTDIQNCLNQILEKVDPLLKDLEERNQYRTKHGPLLEY